MLKRFTYFVPNFVYGQTNRTQINNLKQSNWFKGIFSSNSVYRKLFLTIINFVVWFTLAQAQQPTNIVEAQDPQGYGFHLKKVVSNTTICSGVTFSYTIYFTLPAGTQSATITDVIPPSLVVHSVSVSSANVNPTVNAPTPGTNGTVTVNFSQGSIPQNGFSGSMIIVVSFPNGITCNGTGARNNVCIKAAYQTQSGQVIGVSFCTEYVNTIAQATNSWQIEKKVLNGSWQGGNCPWKIANDTVTYEIRVYKNNPAPCGIDGQLNLVNGVVTDVLPVGAQFISAAPSNGVTFSGNTVTWNVGNLSATQQYNSNSLLLKVYYPPAQFPTNSQITNTATLVGQLGSPQQPCGEFQLSSSVCWEKVLPSPPTTQASIFKWGSTNGQPGCAGTYWIKFCNTGNTALPANSVVIRDTLPSTLTLTSASSWSNLTTTTNGNIVQANLNAPLAPNACTYITINFTISPNATPNSTITNCAYATVQGLGQPLSSCWSFVVNAPTPSPCIRKEICSPQNSYSLGQTIRMRLRVQNIGGQPINGATITDNLDPNFQYIGNPTFYVSNTWNTPCNPNIGSSGVTAWTPAPNLSASGQTITISNVTIPNTCQNLFWSGCGTYGNNTVPYYWVEFDVKIRDTAGLGNIPNFFTLSGGGLSSPVNSNTVYVLTTGLVGFTLNKEVASDTTNWSSSLNVSPGSTFYYRLSMPISSGSVPLRHTTFVDLLPRDAGTVDNRILPNPCQPRGSQFDITYQTGVMTSHPVTWWRNTASTQASATAISIATGSPSLFPTSCGTGTPWVAGVTTGDMNIGMYFTTAVGASNIPTVVFQAKAASNVKPGQIACNSFAAGGAVRHYLNSTNIQDVAVGPLESGNVCIAIDSASKCYTTQISQFPTVIGQTPDGCKYQLVVSLNNPGTTTLQGCATSLQGTVIPSTFNVPVGTSTLTLQFIDIAPQDNYACIYFGVLGSGISSCFMCDSVCFKLPSCLTDTCCPQRVKIDVLCKDKDSTGNQIYQICASGTMPCNATLLLSTNEGTLAPAVFSLGVGSFNICTYFTDTPPPAPGYITLYYTIYGSGVVLCKDSVEIKLPQCPPDPIQDHCCYDWQRTLSTSILSWTPSGGVTIKGLASASVPLQRFSATIVSAQRKVIPNIVPPPPGTWQRIFGDFTNGFASNPPGPLSMLIPFSRELVWGDTCTGQVTPGSFSLKALFPPPPSSWKQRDTLRFTVRYSFTECKCRTCDTLVTYTIVRPGGLPWNPWDNVTISQQSNAVVRMTIPRHPSGGNDEFIEFTSIELSTPHSQLSGKIVGPRKGKDILARIDRSTIVVILERNNEGEPLEIELEGAQTLLKARYHYYDISAKEYGEYDVEYSLSDLKEQTGGVIVQDEGRVDKVRTFALSVINTGKIALQSPTLILQPKPQPDGTIPQILAQGGPSSKQHVTINSNPNEKYSYTITYDDIIEPGKALRPVYLTISGSTQEKIDRVTLEYELRDGDVIIGQGEIELVGAITGIIRPDESDDNTVPHITAIIPNPATDEVTVSLLFPNPTSDAQLVLFDDLGRMILKQDLISPPAGTIAIKLDLLKISNGSYSLVLRTREGISTKRLIIVR